MPPVTRYVKSGDVHLAYQVVGEAALDIVFVHGWVSHVEYGWELPPLARFLNRLASFSRLILFDRRGTGMSDRVPDRELPAHFSETIDYKWDRCIICARCTRVCDEMVGVTAISVIGRGLEAEIGPSYGIDLTDTTCTNCHPHNGDRGTQDRGTRDTGPGMPRVAGGGVARTRGRSGRV